tara:strand:- start:11287 stop:13167 length:1881 start_codon:yes stop_codon:yes gene_type:complete
MCGIVALYGFNDSEKILEKISISQKHRGPDNQGFWDNGKIYFSHQRLSIIDLDSRSNQPFTKNKKTIIFNGEIYNFKIIKKTLEEEGIIFNTESDTEVVLEAFNFYKEKCLDYFEGMFAFIIYDEGSKKSFVARDHFGIKPLFIYSEKNKIAISSELKTLVQIPSFNKEINKKALVNIMNYLWLPGNETIFTSVKKLPPASYMWINQNNSYEIKNYWQLNDENQISSYDDALKQFESVFDKSIEKHLISDVKVGSFLSGGLDSSLISVMAKKKIKNLTTFTISTSEKDKKIEQMPEDEKYANYLANLHSFDHNQIEIKPNIVEDLPKIVHMLDEPIGDPASINTYLICKAARKKGIKVLLSGMGADEIFFGYRRQKATIYAKRYKSVPKIFRKIIRIFVSFMPVKIFGRGLKFIRWSKKFISFAELDLEESYRQSYSYYTDEELKLLFKNDYHQHIPTISKEHRALFNEKYRDDINKMCFTDINFFMNGLNLTYTDRASMAASVEVRVPFIDKKVIETAMKIDGSLKFKNNESKYLLKKFAEKHLPKNIIYRSKASFGAPIRSWISGDLSIMVDNLLSEENIVNRDIFDYEYIKNLIQNDRLGIEDNAYRIYQLLTLELWFREFID